MGLAATFLALTETLSSHVSPDAVATFANHLEHTEKRLADLEVKVTGKVAQYIERVLEPEPAPAAPVPAPTDAGALLAQLAQLLANAQAPAVPATVATPDAAG